MKYNSISEFVGMMDVRGKSFFTKDDIINEFPVMNQHAITNSLSRLIKQKNIISPWRCFYVIVATEFKLKGVVPPSFYIDHLMGFLGRNYYVSLLSAASIHGAAHQQPQCFSVMVDGGAIRGGIKNGTELIINRRKELVVSEIQKVKSQTGYINISSPLLTALDIVCYEDQIGGMSRAAEVITELAEKIDFFDEKFNILCQFPTAVMQRLGCILEIIGENDKANELFSICNKNGVKFRLVALKPSKPTTKEDKTNDKWKLIINQEIETDEI